MEYLALVLHNGFPSILNREERRFVFDPSASLSSVQKLISLCFLRLGSCPVQTPCFRLACFVIGSLRCVRLRRLISSPLKLPPFSLALTRDCSKFLMRAF